MCVCVRARAFLGCVASNDSVSVRLLTGEPTLTVFLGKEMQPICAQFCDGFSNLASMLIAEFY